MIVSDISVVDISLVRKLGLHSGIPLSVRRKLQPCDSIVLFVDELVLILLWCSKTTAAENDLGLQRVLSHFKKYCFNCWAFEDATETSVNSV